MNNNLNIDISTKGKFISELPNRFLCLVKINNIKTKCYVPSSCKLEKLIELKGKEVRLSPLISKKATTPFSLAAISFKRNFILLNSSFANVVVKNNLRTRRFSFLGKRREILNEYTIEGYKTDFYIEDTKTVIEVKSIITANDIAYFPSVVSKRAEIQLNHIKDLLTKEYRAYMILISLNPYLKKIIIKRNSNLFEELRNCTALGMSIIGFSCRYKNSKLIIDSEIPIAWE